MENLTSKADYLDTKGKIINLVCIIVLGTVAFLALTSGEMQAQVTSVLDTPAYLFYLNIFNWATIFLIAISVIILVVGIMYRVKAAALRSGKDNSNKFFWNVLN